MSFYRFGLRRRDVLRGALGMGVAIATSKLTGCSSKPSSTAEASSEPIKIGLVAAITGGSALSGESIIRGLAIAIDEINQKGGILGGRSLELVTRDDESTPARGVAAARELIEQEKVAAVFGGIDSPVSIAMMPVIHELQVPYMGVWAAATKITQNGHDPNFAFRVSANDNIVDRFLIKHVSEAYGKPKVGLMLVNNPWGESNEAGFKQWAPEYGVEVGAIEKFNDTDTDMSAQLARLKDAGVGAVLLVGNAAPGAQVMKSLTRIGWDVPVVSHWGISGGRFPELAGKAASKVVFVQTHSFFGEQNATGQKVMAALKDKYKLNSPGEILAPVGTANAYDAMHLTALAIETAGSTEGPKVREAFYSLPTYEGLIKTYNRSFTPENHDALNEDDYILVQWKGKEIVPVSA
ncbi:ABC transporter substrate-binding protein [Leptolyngbya sp. FACHB-711]|uniref:ABC transporter substrate-binding protein n=1 Tax=unclassified Leptolyngbya TaxID=2650499 RepID=UPI00168552FD|nr:ABC transporter substrate-binding protein [Leptolyngbya sp. FACHB-711]MBD1852548.1 ABC transporter substrate-binding protein [Cyanobacteria bacterium FACHB-502]MBD2026946.1 ABC transporter substrate-binding protein [Leptolyngbya sp. FACHB-711]